MPGFIGSNTALFSQGLECRPADTGAAPCRKPAGWSPWSLRILWLYMIEIPPIPTVYKAYVKGTPEVSWILKADRIKSVHKWLGDVERASILQRILKSWGFHMWSGWADHGSVRDRWGFVQVSDCMRIQHNLFSVVNLCSTPGRCPRCLRNSLHPHGLHSARSPRDSAQWSFSGWILISTTPAWSKPRWRAKQRSHERKKPMSSPEFTHVFEALVT